MNKLQLAINISIDAHEGQKDRGNISYINHPIYLALQMDTEEEKIVALLHDVIEDSTKYTLNDIRKYFGDIIADAVNCITKRKDIGESYNDYLLRVKSNPIALKIKLSDIAHNLTVERIPFKDDKYLRMVKKYEKALIFLNE